MDISLTPHLEAFVADQLKQGRYQTASDVLHEALRLLEERDMLNTIKQDALRREIDIGLAELDRGEGKPLDTEAIKARGRERLQQMQQ